MREARVPSLHTRDGDKNIFSAERQFDAAIRSRAQLQPFSKKLIAQKCFVRGDGLGDPRRCGIDDNDAVGNIQVQRFSLILQHAIEISREAFLL